MNAVFQGRERRCKDIRSILYFEDMIFFSNKFYHPNGCSENIQVSISGPTEIIITSTVTPVDCNGNSTGSIDASVTGSFSIDMHANYMTQYGTPVISSPSAGSIPTHSELDLDYHVLDYDNTIINVTSVTDTGMLYYDIIAVPTNNCTYINILFCEN